MLLRFVHSPCLRRMVPLLLVGMDEIIGEWGYNRGVKIEGDHILWYESPTSFDREGGGCTQTFEHFLANGPWYDGVPPEIVEKLTAAVRAQVKPRKPASTKKRKAP